MLNNAQNGWRIYFVFMIVCFDIHFYKLPATAQAKTAPKNATALIIYFILYHKLNKQISFKTNAIRTSSETI